MKRNIIRTLVGAVACVLLMGQPILAARTGSVNFAGTNVRGEASTSGEVVGNLGADVEVAVTDETTGTDGKTWYQIEFTFEGEEKTGWMRSDLLTVTGEEDPVETPEEEPEAENGTGVGNYVIIEPEEEPVGKDNVTQMTIQVNGNLFTAWQVDTSLTDGAEIFLIYTQDENGEKFWSYYDGEDKSVQKDRGQYDGGGSESEGLIESLRTEITNVQEESEAALQMRFYMIVALIALSAILLVVVVVLGIKLNQVEYMDEDEEEQDKEEEESDLTSFYSKPKKETIREEKVEEFELPEIEMPEIEMPEIEEMDLPEIDMEIIKTPEVDDFEDIEILDWDDLDL